MLEAMKVIGRDRSLLVSDEKVLSCLIWDVHFERFLEVVETLWLNRYKHDLQVFHETPAQPRHLISQKGFFLYGK